MPAYIRGQGDDRALLYLDDAKIYGNLWERCRAVSSRAVVAACRGQRQGAAPSRLGIPPLQRWPKDLPRSAKGANGGCVRGCEDGADILRHRGQGRETMAGADGVGA